MSCGYATCDKPPTPGHVFCSRKHLNFDSNSQRLCIFCGKNQRINSGKLMFKSCGEQECLIFNGQDLFVQFQNMEGRAHRITAELNREKRRADSYKEDYYKERNKKRACSRESSREQHTYFQHPYQPQPVPSAAYPPGEVDSNSLRNLSYFLRQMKDQSY